MNKIAVHMTKEALYDFLLFHAYSKFSGFLINILGLAIAFMGILMYVTGKIGTMGVVFYLAAAVLFLAATPFQLKMRAKQQIKVNKEYSGTVEYTFSKEGICAEREEKKLQYTWEQIQRAVVTPKTIGIYYDEEKAFIIPKEDFGDQFAEIFQLIAVQLGQSRMRLR